MRGKIKPLKEFAPGVILDLRKRIQRLENSGQIKSSDADALLGMLSDIEQHIVMMDERYKDGGVTWQL